MRKLPTQRVYLWFLGILAAVVIAIGWKYPLVGFVVPVAMLIGMAGGFFRGRWVCGNLCPRGGFLGTWLNNISRHRETPEYLKKRGFRWILFASLMGFMTYQLSLDFGNLYHWGFVFWQMCFVTTAVAVVVGIPFGSRSWCTFCPIGTTAAEIGGDKYLLNIDENCRSCNLCNKVCPMELDIPKHKTSGKVCEPDCIKCSNCITVCPQQSLTWPQK